MKISLVALSIFLAVFSSLNGANGLGEEGEEVPDGRDKFHQVRE